MLEPPSPSSPPVVTVYGNRWCSDCHAARALLEKAAVAYRWIDIDLQPAAIPEMLELNGGVQLVPTMVFADGRVLVEPERERLITLLASLGSASGPPARAN